MPNHPLPCRPHAATADFRPPRMHAAPPGDPVRRGVSGRRPLAQSPHSLRTETTCSEWQHARAHNGHTENNRQKQAHPALPPALPSVRPGGQMSHSRRIPIKPHSACRAAASRRAGSSDRQPPAERNRTANGSGMPAAREATPHKGLCPTRSPSSQRHCLRRRLPGRAASHSPQ